MKKLRSTMRAANRMRVPGTGGLEIGDLARKVARQVREDHIKAFAGNLAYRGLFAMFAVLLLAFSLLGMFGATDVIEKALAKLDPTIPEPVMESLRKQILTATKRSSAARAWGLSSLVSVLAALYGLSATARGVIDAMNVMYEIDERRPFLKRVAASIAMSLVVIALLVGALLLVLAGAGLAEQVGAALGVENAFSLVASVLRWPVLAAVVLFAFALVYQFAPAQRRRFRWISPGTVAAAGMWLVFSLGFSLYVENLGSFSATYGTLAGIVVLLLYMFASSFILLVGAEIDDVVDRDRQSGAASRKASRPNADRKPART